MIFDWLSKFNHFWICMYFKGEELVQLFHSDDMKSKWRLLIEAELISLSILKFLIVLLLMIVHPPISNGQNLLISWYWFSHPYKQPDIENVCLTFRWFFFFFTFRLVSNSTTRASSKDEWYAGCNLAEWKNKVGMFLINLLKKTIIMMMIH